ncbi:hypothetical protein JZ751_025275 [Albula glossodonta]|uniref:Uncharacterized protein n=1 Tax=Albula glossodonta TaxID=121402 RepID=A0A8T2NGH8_9TELE|nr:hypothetical protein JZ751_025275 [Albula glossodonta]
MEGAMAEGGCGHRVVGGKENRSLLTYGCGLIAKKIDGFQSLSFQEVQAQRLVPSLWENFDEPHVPEAEVNEVLQQLFPQLILNGLKQEKTRKSRKF